MPQKPDDRQPPKVYGDSLARGLIRGEARRIKEQMERASGRTKKKAGSQRRGAVYRRMRDHLKKVLSDQILTWDEGGDGKRARLLCKTLSPCGDSGERVISEFKLSARDSEVIVIDNPLRVITEHAMQRLLQSGFNQSRRNSVIAWQSEWMLAVIEKISADPETIIADVELYSIFGYSVWEVTTPTMHYVLPDSVTGDEEDPGYCAIMKTFIFHDKLDGKKRSLWEQTIDPLSTPEKIWFYENSRDTKKGAVYYRLKNVQTTADL